MAGYYAMLGRSPSLAEIMQSAGLTGAQRRERELRGEEVRYARDRQDRLDTQAAEERRLDQEAARQKFEAEREKAAQLQTANKDRFWGQMLERNPGQADRIYDAARAQGVDLGGTLVTPDTAAQAQATGVQIDDAITPEQAALDLQGRAAGVLGVQKPDELPAVKRSTYAQQLVDSGVPEGSPQFAKAMDRYNRAEIRRMEREPRGGININLGGKPVPAGSAESLGDAEAALIAVDDMLASFTENVPNEGLAEQVMSRGKVMIPNTDESIYDSESDAAVQVFGRFLEGGVLKEAEVGRYKKMAPKAGDSFKTAERKARALKRRIQVAIDKRRAALGDAGYRVDLGAQGTPSDEQIEAELREIEGM